MLIFLETLPVWVWQPDDEHEQEQNYCITLCEVIKLIQINLFLKYNVLEAPW